MNRCVLAAAVVGALVAGCDHNVYEIDMSPRGRELIRTITVWRSGDDKDKAPEKVPASELTRIAEAYPGVVPIVKNENGKKKHSFRATLVGMWVLLDTAMLISHIATGKIDAISGIQSVKLLPALAVATALGEFMHGRLNEHTFRLAVYVVLFFAGASVVLHEL